MCSLSFDPQLNILDWESRRVDSFTMTATCRPSLQFPIQIGYLGFVSLKTEPVPRSSVRADRAPRARTKMLALMVLTVAT